MPRPSPPPQGAPDRFTLGVLYVAAAGVLYGTLVILAKLAYATGIAPLPLLVLRYGLAAALMWGALALVSPQLLRLKPRERALGVGLGLLYASQSFVYFWGFQTVDAAVTGILFNTFPLWVALFAAAFLGERVTAEVAAALGLGVVGTALTAGVWTRAVDLYGAVLILAAALGYATYVVAARKGAANLPSESVAAHVFLGSALGFLAAALATGSLPLQVAGNSFLYAAALAILATLLPILLFLKGLKIIGASRAGVIGTLEPVVTVVLAWGVLGSTLGPLQALGGALVLAASFLVHRSGMREREAASEVPRE
jgi:drug/metabolite transporter (DMT)-like permease